MKRTPVFSILLALLIFAAVSYNANAAHFKCDLSLNVIEDTESSEHKQLEFDLDLNPGLKNSMTGSMITSTCFNTLIDPFTSDTSEFKKIMIGNLVHGTLHDNYLTIGKNHYQLDLSFAEVSNDQLDNTDKTLEASGKLLPLDNPDYIHQNIIGECYLSEEQLLAPKSIPQLPEGCR